MFWNQDMLFYLQQKVKIVQVLTNQKLENRAAGSLLAWTLSPGPGTRALWSTQHPSHFRQMLYDCVRASKRGKVAAVQQICHILHSQT